MKLSFEKLTTFRFQTWTSKTRILFLMETKLFKNYSLFWIQPRENLGNNSVPRNDQHSARVNESGFFQSADSRCCGRKPRKRTHLSRSEIVQYFFFNDTFPYRPIWWSRKWASVRAVGHSRQQSSLHSTCFYRWKVIVCFSKYNSICYFRVCTIKTVDSAPISAYAVHECEGSSRMGGRPRRFLFCGTIFGTVQVFSLFL